MRECVNAGPIWVCPVKLHRSAHSTIRWIPMSSPERRIVVGISGSLLTRAADVTLKEHRPLVLMVRETPLHVGHLRSMTQVCEMGGIVMPPVPAFYARPQSIQDMVDHTVGRMLDLLGLDCGTVRRWG
ncbi:hypothetical protein AWU82_15645 [Pseudomonas glycinae]|uniref:Flavoprotein domain-containing protein n=1 Tax=Pseudomonas glycinae TaxID=1785145 RepID=A0ABN5FNT3_9PSED|nr:hypothetical protein AWU82_15645 [Pseudomonas glycinae]